MPESALTGRLGAASALRGLDDGDAAISWAPLPSSSYSIENAAFHSAPPGREVDFGIVPRTALRLSWAIFLASLREETRRFVPRHNAAEASRTAPDE